MSKKQLDVVDAILHDAALVEAEQGKTTPAQKQIAKQVAAAAAARVAELRRALVPAADPPAKAKPIRASLLALGRDALIAKLDAIAKALAASGDGRVQYAHRNLDGLSDDDLRRLIDLLDPDSESPTD